MLICYRCLEVQSESDLLSSNKIKSLPLETSRKKKRCRKCKCRWFFNPMI